MLRAIAGYIVAVPVATLAFWLVGGGITHSANAAPLLSVIFSAVFFTPLLLVLGLPGLLTLIIWSSLLGGRVWVIASLLAGLANLLLFAYTNQVMCRVQFMGSDCWGNITFQMTERSPFVAEYPMVFWISVVCTFVFWLVFARDSLRQRRATRDPPSAAAQGDT